MPNKYRQEIIEEINKTPKHPAGNFKGRPFDLNKYLKQNKDTLPKIAIRETSKKLLTGKK